ncbi:MAG: rod shape-determining protein MreC [Angelakisella sp.]
MNDFFRSKTFKIIAVLLAAVLAFFLRAVYTGGLMPALSHIGGAVATPFGEFFAGIGNGIQDFFQPIFHGRELQKENEDLQKLVDELTRRQADYDELKNQNDLYRRFFSISDSNADYTLEPATVIAHVPDDPSGSFIINIGQSQGITSGMPVITENGLVGIVGRVSERYCRVLTLMDPAVNIGVLDSTTLDTGILTGDAAMSEDNTARLTYLRLQSEAAAGDLILTSGYGEQIPQGLTVGYLSEVSLAATGLTLEGVIDLSARPENARQVFVITDFTVTQTPSEEVPRRRRTRKPSFSLTAGTRWAPGQPGRLRPGAGTGPAAGWGGLRPKARSRENL